MFRILSEEFMMKFLIMILIFSFVPSIGQADAEAGKEKAQICMICHKPNFSSASIPLLAGQKREYLYKQIKDFKEKRRPSSFMQLNVANLSDQDMHDIADYFSSREVIRETFSLDSVKINQGESKAEELKCASCHMADFSGDKEVPSLVAIDPIYIMNQVVAFQTGNRLHPLINSSTRISESDTEDLAQYFAQLE
jgi:cytochrome c553